MNTIICRRVQKKWKIDRLIKSIASLPERTFTIFKQLGISSVVSQNYFCIVMIKISFIFLLLFTFIQVVPAFMNYCDEATSVFITEEKNGEEKNESGENKDQKYFSQFSNISEELSHNLHTAFQVVERNIPLPAWKS